MKKLTLLLCGKDTDRIVRRLMYLKCAEIRQIDGASELGLEALHADSDVAALGAQITGVGEAMKAIRPMSPGKKGLFPPRIDVSIESFIADGRYVAALAMADAINEKVAERSRIAAELARLDEERTALGPWKNYDLRLDFAGTDTTSVVIGSFPSSVKPDRFGEIELAGGAIEVTNEDKNARYVTVVYHKNDEDAVLRSLAKLGFNKASFTNGEGLAVTELKALDAREQELNAADAKLLGELREYAKKYDELEILSDALGTELNAAEAKLRLSRTENCVFLMAWVPEDKVERVSGELDKYDCAYSLTDPEEGDEPPVLLKNNEFAKSFEWVLGMYSYPKYGTYDPTFIMGIFYCIIFGMMFADVGYGLLMMLICFLGAKLLKLKESMKRFLLMFGWCGVGSTLMGVLFGGYFGDLPIEIMTNLMGVEAPETLAVLVDPMLDPMSFLIYALIMGGIHLITGMALKMYITWTNGHKLDALLDTLPIWLLFAGLGLLVLRPSVGKWVAIAGVAAMILTQGRKNKNLFMKLGGGLYSLYGLINFASDLVSYSRIMALGLASAVVAQVVNILGTMLGGSAVGTFFMIVIFIIGHALNMAINILGSFVHTSRLQYIEFFGKFFEEGGTAFRPVAPADNYTIDNSNNIN